MATSNTISNSQLQQQQQQQQHETSQQFDKMSIDLPWNYKEKNKCIQTVQPREEQKLLQKMSELSTKAANKNVLLIKDIQVEIDKIPDYLTKQNQSFQQILYQALSITKIASKDQDSIENLRKIAILIYKIMVIQTYQRLWTAYLKSGIGQLIIQSQKQRVVYPTNIPIWPKELKTMVLSNNVDDKTKEHESCFKFVNDQLSIFEHQLKHYQMELNMKANRFQGYTFTMQNIMETYIEKNLQIFRMKIEHQVDLIHYDYHIRALKLEYDRQKPNKYQEELMREICQSKYEQETSEKEYHFLKQQIAFYKLPNQSFEYSSVAQSLPLDSIQNTTIRQELFKQFQEVAEQSRVALFNVYLQSAEEQREEHKKKYHADKQKIDSSRKSLDQKEKLSAIMIHLIEERCHKISERIKCIYKCKAHSFLMKS